ncbi:hypothetical protein SBD_3921 [Streptomyces bottropensis ATCC 25435]|uniref:Uncharacterized protein n=1 Tax=Streptomyces bottropensis ATCC 25435 TaxID=1054862 RepID=M3EYF3_9ACTN|nr:hypothetical protein SBD_3921 [Streptomyces bottropensis ATCC 25435]
MVDVSRRLSLLAFVAPHCAVPSVPWSQPLANGLRPTAERCPPGNGVRSTAEHGLPPSPSSPETWTPALGQPLMDRRGALGSRSSQGGGTRAVPLEGDGRPQPYRPICTGVSAQVTQLAPK